MQFRETTKFKLFGRRDGLSMRKKTLLITLIAILLVSVFGFLLMMVLTPFRAKLFFSDPGFDMKPVVSDVLDAIKSQDVAKIESMLCPGIQLNTKDLPEKIKELMDSIQGDIAEITWDGATASTYKREGGKQRLGKFSPVTFTTTTGLDYSLTVGYTYVDDFDFEAIGLDELQLLLVYYEDQSQNEALYQISYYKGTIVDR